ncbi:MAG TPA: PEP-CTERM sorting domain-containing protein [Terriglobia bacterium]|nr:PEP-CTERM sorting domain-containing protein [Terriglobia bacterium]
MRRLLMSVAAVGILMGAAASAAKADSITLVRTIGTYSYNDYQPWAEIGVNNFNVTNGTVATSQFGTVSTTINFAQGGPGSTLLECPATNCTWAGTFGPGDSILASYNKNSHKGEGAIDLTFSKGLSGIGFEIQGNEYGTFSAEIEAFNGSTPLGTFYAFNGVSGYDPGSAIFMGLQDLSGANITGIDILAYNCSGNNGGSCNGTAVDRLLFETGTPTPEPSSLLLLGSGLGALTFLRRKLFSRS